MFSGTYAFDTASTVARLIVAATALLMIFLGTAELAGSARESETYSLLPLGTLGATVLASASDLLVLIVEFSLTSIALYGLIGITGRADAAEAAVKATPSGPTVMLQFGPPASPPTCSPTCSMTPSPTRGRPRIRQARRQPPTLTSRSRKRARIRSAGAHRPRGGLPMVGKVTQSGTG